MYYVFVCVHVCANAVFELTPVRMQPAPGKSTPRKRAVAATVSDTDSGDCVYCTPLFFIVYYSSEDTEELDRKKRRRIVGHSE